MCQPLKRHLGKPRQKRRFISENRRRVVVGMAALPIRKNQQARALLAKHASDFQTILPGVFDAAVRDIERVSPRYFQDAGRLCRFASAVFHVPASAHLTLTQVEDAGTVSALRHFEEGARAGLFYIVAMRG